MIVTAFNDIQRFGYSNDLVQARGLKPSPFLLDCLSILDSLIKKKQQKVPDNAR